MDYFELQLSLCPDTEVARDVVAAALGEIGFESFLGSDTGLSAFVAENLYSEAAIDQALNHLPLAGLSVQYRVERIAARDWNEEWERHFFKPVVIGGEVAIHSSFHGNVPPCRYDITIDPRMAFGTGHHATTALMVSYLADLDVKGRSVLDMGCGTCILAILARMKGASPVTAIDVDEWACLNAEENTQLNGTPDVLVLQGDAALLEGRRFDMILANINRNSLLRDMPAYERSLAAGASLIMSGFYDADREIIDEQCQALGLHPVSFREKEHWAAVHYIK
jgi:ribosomal protein L11 methyltransferase